MRDGFDDLVRGHFELVLHMYRAGSNKGMDTGRFSAADRIVGCLDVLVYAARKRADGRAANGISDCCDRSCITGRRSCKAGLDDVDLATSIFSLRFMEQPGDCSPSRRVVSKILIVLLMVSCPLLRVMFVVQGQKKLRPLILH